MLYKSWTTAQAISIFPDFAVIAFRLDEFLLEIPFLVNQDKCDSHRDCRVGDIEYGPKEDELLATPKGEPRGIGAINQRKIKHVNHLAVEETGIASLRRKQLSLIKPGALAKNDSVERRIDNVTQRTGKNKRHVEDKSPMILLLDHVVQAIANANDRHNAKQGQG